MSLHTFWKDGEAYSFDKAAFNRYFEQFKKTEHLQTGVLLEKLADDIGISADAVKKWRSQSGGGPGDEITLERLAAALHVAMEDLLVKNNVEEVKTKMLTGRQLAAAKRICDSCILFLEDFLNTDGFASVWSHHFSDFHTAMQQDVFDYVDSRLNGVWLVYRQEYFDLHGCPIYDELFDFINGDLMDIYDGKLGYGYRYEAADGSGVTASEDYDKTVIALHHIIDRYTESSQSSIFQ